MWGGGYKQTARDAGAKLMVFDWERAAQIIKDRQASQASAGLEGDWEYTGGIIFEDGKMVEQPDTYLASLWATPLLIVDGDYFECWKYREEACDWDSGTVWPQSARDILLS